MTDAAPTLVAHPRRHPSPPLTLPRVLPHFLLVFLSSGFPPPFSHSHRLSATAPFVAGLFQPMIYLPRHCGRWEKETLRMVLLHELGHVARRDLWTNLAARLACVIYWFNPLVWWLRSKLITQCEFACDARVIAAGTNRDNYANALCDVAEASSLPASAMAMPMAGRTPLGARRGQLRRPRPPGLPPLRPRGAR